ncbi:hypothetical protein OV203_14300 [Nannocystis sp. ILAH1]|uniref:hypothetical protein n=1 Tax=unclassified Nannocystis TaxID=2627009 RepID=UPI00226E874B|nr:MULTISPECIES: hypothetical protein [unclassified Nannocystis]MCY0988299.1 hypothetical protein [Nannocystis sp. ILAH1]MCY1067740.1 hypothetical protein [Nannocystis sp. RBIL2]
MSPTPLAEALAAADALLQVHPLAAVRVVAMDDDALVLEVYHCEWPPPALPAFGRLCFVEPVYVQMPMRLEWGTRLHLFSGSVAGRLPSLPTASPDAPVFILRAHDGSDPPAFIVAAGLRVEPTR